MSPHRRGRAHVVPLARHQSGTACPRRRRGWPARASRWTRPSGSSKRDRCPRDRSAPQRLRRELLRTSRDPARNPHRGRRGSRGRRPGRADLRRGHRRSRPDPGRASAQDLLADRTRFTVLFGHDRDRGRGRGKTLRHQAMYPAEFREALLCGGTPGPIADFYAAMYEGIRNDWAADVQRITGRPPVSSPITPAPRRPCGADQPVRPPSMRPAPAQGRWRAAPGWGRHNGAVSDGRDAPNRTELYRVSPLFAGCRPPARRCPRLSG